MEKMASKTCPFCHENFDQTDIKDHIGITHFKPILLGTENQDIKESLLTALGLNPLVVSEKLTSKDLQDHGMLEFETNDQEPRFQCAYCDRIFNWKHNLARHIQSVHEGVKFPCQVCPMIYSNQDCLRRHMKARLENL